VVTLARKASQSEDITRFHEIEVTRIYIIISMILYIKNKSRGTLIWYTIIE